MAQAWMIIERLENWRVDASNDFSFFGLSNRYNRIAAKIAENDIVFCYVSSGVSAFSDIRIVTETGLKPLKNQTYDAAFPNYFATRPILTLARERWVPIKTLASQLDLTRGKIDYRNLLMTSIRKLTEHDALLLEEQLRSVAAKAS